MRAVYVSGSRSHRVPRRPSPAGRPLSLWYSVALGSVPVVATLFGQLPRAVVTVESPEGRGEQPVTCGREGQLALQQDPPVQAPRLEMITASAPAPPAQSPHLSRGGVTEGRSR